MKQGNQTWTNGPVKSRLHWVYLRQGKLNAILMLLYQPPAYITLASLHLCFRVTENVKSALSEKMEQHRPSYQSSTKFELVHHPPNSPDLARQTATSSPRWGRTSVVAILTVMTWKQQVLKINKLEWGIVLVLLVEKDEWLISYKK